GAGHSQATVCAWRDRRTGVPEEKARFDPVAVARRTRACAPRGLSILFAGGKRNESEAWALDHFVGDSRRRYGMARIRLWRHGLRAAAWLGADGRLGRRLSCRWRSGLVWHGTRNDVGRGARPGMGHGQVPRDDGPVRRGD